MSLLEDIFLQDEADEAQELERVIEGDEYDERPRSRSVTPNSDENEVKDDEAEEDKRRVDPSSTKAKRVTKNPRFILNPARLTGPRGIQIIPDHFKDFKFKGKGHEKEDLDMVLKKLEHWAYRLYPKFQFEDCLKKIETLGKKRPVMVHLHKIRTDQFMSEDTVVQKDSSDEETQQPQEEDEFDKLLQQQIELARATPAPGSVKKVIDTPRQDRSSFTIPKATSSPSISDEQKERMIRNRKLAEERRLARLKQNSINTSKDSAINISGIIEVDEEAETNVRAKKNNRSHVIDSSDDECNVSSVNQAVTVDVHNRINDDVNVEIERRNFDDIAMEQNDSIEAHQDAVEITDDCETVGNNVDSSDRIVDVIEINDQVDRNIVNNKNHEDVTEIIEINDKVFEVMDDTEKLLEVGQSNNMVDEIIEINDVDNIRNSNVEVLKENENIQIVDMTVLENIENHSTNKDSIETQNTDVDLEQIKSNDGDNLHNNSESNKSSQDVSLGVKDTNTADDFTEEIMDVDFSDDF